MDFSADPFSILTIIKGSENYSQESLQQEGPIHKALETLATWNEIWPSGQPPALEEKSFTTVKKKVANDVLDRFRSGENTYRTWSTRAEIEQNGFSDAATHPNNVL